MLTLLNKISSLLEQTESKCNFEIFLFFTDYERWSLNLRCQTESELNRPSKALEKDRILSGNGESKLILMLSPPV